MGTLPRRVAVFAAVILTAACTHDPAAPPLAGPSEFATSLQITVTPDTLNQDGASQANVQVLARNASAQPMAGLNLRLDMAVGGVLQDFGSLAARSLVTGANGQASTVYTAPPPSPPPASGAKASVTIVVTPVANNAQAQAASAQSATISLVPAGVILPPPSTSTPVAVFTFSPSPVNLNVPTGFDASTSCGVPLVGSQCPPATSNNQIVTYSWSFGDGTVSAMGKTVTHTFTTASPTGFTVTLTVTNALGYSASSSQTLPVTASAAPTVSFVFSPAAPAINQTVVFNGDASRAAPGHTIVQYSWIFGDGSGANGFVASHAFTAVGTYAVTLTVLDDVGQKATTSNAVSVTATGVGATPPTAAFVFSPSAPVVNQTVSFNGATSTAAVGHTIQSYAWNFGDGSTGTGGQVSHPYAVSGTYAVTLTVTDDTGQMATASNQVPVGSGNPTASFTIVPSPATAGAPASFNGAASTAAPGASIATYQWSFGDGTSFGPSSSPSTTHSYGAAGTYTVTLTVADSATPARYGTTTNAVVVVP